MVKILSFLRCRPPSVPGFPDPVTLFDVDQSVLEIVEGRSGCNAVKPNQPANKAAWDLWYTCIAPGTYDAQYIYDVRNLLCIVINGGREIPTVLPSQAHGWRSVASGVEVHPSDTDEWPGSKACPTIRKSQWPRITQHLTIGEKLKVEIKLFNG